MQEIRCKKCNKLLGKVKEPQYFSINIKDSTIKEIDKPEEEPKFNFDSFVLEIKCPRCGHMNTNKGECQNGENT